MTVPFIKINDCRHYEKTKDIVRISNIQLISPFDEGTFGLTNENEQKRLILDYINDAIDNGADLVVLPELSTSRAICDEIYNRFSNDGKVIIMGSYFDELDQNISEILIGEHRIKQAKNNPSKLEKSRMKRGNEVNIFINTPIGDFAVLICYDATDFAILNSLQDFTDLFICIARNIDVGLFDHMFRALTYLKYQYIIFCNDGKYGGSCIYAPFHGNRKLDTMGVDNQGIIYRDINLGEIDKFREYQRESKKWKHPPASAKSRRAAYQNKEEKHEDIRKKLLNYMNCPHDVFKRFLSIIYDEMTCTLTKEVDSIRGIESMHPLSLSDIAEESRKFILDEYKKKQKDSSQLYCGKQYFLFELDCDALRDEHILHP